jgi:hypothetical protein
MSLPVSASEERTEDVQLQLDVPCTPSRSNLRIRDLEVLVSKACVSAAISATGTRTPYKLEVCYGSETYAGQWERLAKGTPQIRRAVARRDPGVAERMTRVRQESSLVDDVISWSFWRSLDPRDYLAEELAFHPSDVGAFGPPELHVPLQERAACRRYVMRVREKLQDARTRYEAINALWRWIRLSRVHGDIPLLVLSYRLWSEARPILQADEVLGSICDDLYEWAGAHFAQAQVSREHCARLFRGGLARYGIEFDWDDQDRQMKLSSDPLGTVDPAGPFRRRRFGT